MAGNLWTKEEVQFVIDKIKKEKLHPFDIVPLFFKEFGRARTFSSIKNKALEFGIDYAHLARSYDKMPPKQQRIPPKKAVAKDVKDEVLRQKLREYQSKYQVLSREVSIENRMLQVLKDEVPQLPKVSFSWKRPEAKKTHETAVLLLGDAHLGERVEKEAVYGLGEYNFDIFVKRLKFLSESIKSIAVKKLTGYQIDKLIVFMLGDMVSGLIHDELAENAEDIIFQVLNGAYVTAQFILDLQQLFPTIEVAGVVGNHGRLHKKKRHKKRYVNFDFIFYQFLATFLASNDQIRCTFPKSPFMVKKIYDWGFLILHGDNIRSWMGIPWYGIQRAMWRLGDLLQGKGMKIHYRILGHFHNTGEVDRTPGELIINGSVKGGDEYSLGGLFEFDRPTQLFMGVHARIGATWRYPLRLDLPGVDKVEPYKYREELDAAKYMRNILEEEKS